MKIFFGCNKSFYLEGRGNLPIGIGTCANLAKGLFTALLLETAVTASGHSIAMDMYAAWGCNTQQLVWSAEICAHRKQHT